ncbi:MAG: CRISPR-associated protein Cas4 [Thermoprotei archaeon]|nr:MAG: CRISPR-associated protein Cas4 [Thermoprotei archaeon]
MLLSRSYRLEKGYLPISLLKEFVYCPRYAYWLVFGRPKDIITESMRIGKDYTYDELTHILREEGYLGRIHTNVFLRSEKLRLEGYVDAVIEQDSYVHIAEMKKLTQASKRILWKKKSHILVQGMAYAIAAEETFKKTIGDVVIILKDKIIRVKPKPSLRITVENYTKQLWDMIEKEEIPPAKRSSKCYYCQFRNVCF